ncbi:MAG TPA: zf-HC2 domain-containing protein [Terriglobales bacterium]|nr:zf-HC2 domain-containing protein [Terriglobales bacterium]
MRCGEAKSLFSPYVDGAVTGAQMHDIEKHLQHCPVCTREYLALQRTQQLLTSLSRKKAPPDLALKLRVAISQEAAESRRAPLQGFWLRLQNTLEGLMVPATAGLVTALVIFGVLMGVLALPPQLQASNDDVPLMLYTAPELKQTFFGTSLSSITGDALVIEAYVDANGRVQDYRILSDPDPAKDLLPQVKNMLIFTTFRPATAMGRPTAGRAVLSFSKISVRG